jgi:hypothetical protein
VQDTNTESMGSDLDMSLDFLNLAGMPRPRRAAEGGLIYHVLNRANARLAAHFSIGGVYAVLGKMSEVEAMLREAIRLRPRFPAAYARYTPAASNGTQRA